MDWQGWLSLTLTLGAMITLALTRIGPHMIMLGVMAILSVTGVLTAGGAHALLHYVSLVEARSGGCL